MQGFGPPIKGVPLKLINNCDKTFPGNTSIMQAFQNQQIMRLTAQETAGKQVGVAIYDGTNYYEWSSELQVVLIASDLWRVTQVGLPKQQDEYICETSNETKERKEKAEKMLTKNDKALGKILLSIDKRFRTTILEQDLSAKDAWEYLRKDSLLQATVRSRLLNAQFSELKYDQEIEMSVYLSQVASLVSEMSRLGNVLSDAQVVEQVIVSLQGCSGSEIVIASIDDMEPEKKNLQSISSKLVLWRSRIDSAAAKKSSIEEIVQGQVLALWNKQKNAKSNSNWNNADEKTAEKCQYC